MKKKTSINNHSYLNLYGYRRTLTLSFNNPIRASSCPTNHTIHPIPYLKTNAKTLFTAWVRQWPDSCCWFGPAFWSWFFSWFSDFGWVKSSLKHYFLQNKLTEFVCTYLKGRLNILSDGLFLAHLLQIILGLLCGYSDWHAFHEQSD